MSLAEGLSTVTGSEWEDLGMPETMWKFETNRLGPLVVAMDSKGNSLYEQVRNGLKSVLLSRETLTAVPASMMLWFRMVTSPAL